MGEAAGAEARSAEHPPGVGSYVVSAILVVMFGGGCGSTGGGASGAGGGGGTGGGTPAGCVPSENASAVGDECGVFVSAAGEDGAEGTKGAPVKTLAAAIGKAQESGSRRVYACAESFAEMLEVPGGVTLYGGLECAAGWSWVGETKKTTLTAGEGEIPLRLRGGEGAAHVEDLEVVAASIDAAANPLLKGASSIAAFAEGITVELVRSTLTAGDAAPGMEGASHAPSAAPSGAAGNNGNEACSAAMIFGGGEAVNNCGTPDDATDDSIGGSGGIGQANSGGAGSPGAPGNALNGGAGETVAVCTAGTLGDNGPAGEPGAGATGLGTITTSGYAGVSGTDGTRGAPGQGGGGGGGAKGGSGAGKCPDAMSAGGSSGASGGSGGCGGLGGRGGGPGGASIALVSLGATLSFDSVTLRTGQGGAGGTGGPGQNGGLGGPGGTGGTVPGGSTLKAGCDGGPGGSGGMGGRGGGGLGGHSIGIAYQGKAPPAEGVTIETAEAGPGGAGADAQHQGGVGVKANTQEVP